MNEIKLTKGSCPLCNIKIRQPTQLPDDPDQREYDCPNCGPFSISLMAYRFTPIINNDEVRAKLSYFIRHNSTEENPIFIDQYFLDDNNIQSIILPTSTEQLNNFLFWFDEESNHTFDTVDGNTYHLPALLGCKNHYQVIYLLDQLWSDGYIEMQVPTTPPLRDRGSFELFASHLTRKGMEKIEKSKKSDVISFNNSIVDVEQLLLGKETINIEIKGSFRLDLDRLLKGDHQRKITKDVAKNGVLKAIVGFLNTIGGHILIGAIEKNKFNTGHLSNIEFVDVGSYYIIGIKIEESSEDNYELNLRNLISGSISNELVELVDITFPAYENFTLCLITVNKASHKWYYLEKRSFFVRSGNQTIELNGADADDYKNRNPRNIV